MSAVESFSSDMDAEWRPTVLVVEDEALIRMMLSECLEQAGCDVIEASSADEALPVLCDARGPDILITDVMLPGSVDGLELAAWVRRHRPGLKVVITSGHASRQDAAALADAFLPKPFALEQLVRQVRTLAAA